MAEYIEKAELIKKLCFETAEWYYSPTIKTIKEFPAADIQPVKHGYWIKQPEKFQIYEDVINSNYLYSCSCCNASDLHSERANNDGEVKFCWRCGTKMNEKE